MKIKVLVGAGDRVMGTSVPFMAGIVAANVAWPDVFKMGLGIGGIVAGLVLLAVGVPIWLVAVGQIVYHVPRRQLITTWSFRVMAHPIYTSVALLVIPGVSLLVDTWSGFAIGAVLYCATRIFAPAEDRILARFFPEEYPKYRSRILLPWL